MPRPLRDVRGLLLLSACLAFAQTAALEFDAASVKQVTFPKDGRWAIGCNSDPGQYSCDYIMLYDLIADAYSVPAGRKIVGPDWMRSNPYSVHAKAAGPASRADLKIMLQHLLASRFQLKLHTEDRPAPVYALVVGGKSIRLDPVTYDGDPNQGAFHPKVSGTEFKHTSMAMFAGFLSGWANLGRPVIDETGIKELYDFDLSYATKGFTPILDPPPDSDLPSIFEAIKKIGLKLESRQANITTYIVDHVEQVPTEN
jgi:uncharacterized protein (TIGR03435 family)